MIYRCVCGGGNILVLKVEKSSIKLERRSNLIVLFSSKNILVMLVSTAIFI